MAVKGAQRVLSILLNTRTKWNSGWSSVSPFSAKGPVSVLMLAADTGKAQVRPINSMGLVSGVLDRRDWSGGWTTAEFYTVGASTFLFLLKEATGEVHVNEVDADGTIGAEVDRRDWSGGWTTAEFYTVGASTFLFLLKEATGEVHVNEVDADGTIGAEVDRRDWSGGWTTAEFYTVGASTFLFLLKEATGEVHVNEVDADGTIGAEVDRRDWSGGWTTAEFYTVGASTFLFLLKEATGEVHVNEVDADGTIGAEVDRRDWSGGWTTAEFYTVGASTFLFLLKEATGDGHTHSMESDGTIGVWLDPPRPRPRADYVELMLSVNTQLLEDYIGTQSETLASIDGSHVTDWLTYEGSWEDFKEFGRGAEIAEAKSIAESTGVDIHGFSYFVAFIHDGPDSGSSGNGVLVNPPRETLEFVTHELLHTFGLDHSFSNAPNPASAPAWQKDGEYGDNYDIMSALSSTGYGGVPFAQRGPQLNAFGRSMLGWLNEDHVEHVFPRRLSPGAHTIELQPLHSFYDSPRVVRIHRTTGEYYSIEFRPRFGWDRALKARTLIHHVRPTKYIQSKSEIDRRDWSGGWTTAEFYTVGASTFLFLLKEATGEVHVNEVDADGTIGAEVDRRDWSGGWTTAEFYTVGASTFLFLLKEATGEVHVNEVDADGTIGAEVDRRDWSGGWTTAEFYTVGASTFLFLLKEATGEVHVNEVDADGTIGAEVDRRDWSGGWTTAEFYTVGASTFLFLLKEATGEVHVNEVDADGTIGALSKALRWSSGWSNVEFYGTSPVYLVASKPNHKTPDGTASLIRVMHLDANGFPDSTTHERTWTAGWSELRIVRTQLLTALFALKPAEGDVVIHRLSAAYLIRDLPSRIPSIRLRDPIIQKVISVSVEPNGRRGFVSIQ